VDDQGDALPPWSPKGPLTGGWWDPVTGHTDHVDISGWFYMEFDDD